jgi:osmotically-inducible protein OsmY
MINQRPIIHSTLTATLLLGLCACAPTPVSDKSAPSADANITETIRTAIYKRAELAGDDINVQTHEGVVYLYGLVDTNPERETVESIARAVPGVKRIVDSIKTRNYR